MLYPLLASVLVFGLSLQPVWAGDALDVPLPGKRSIVRVGAIPNPVTETARQDAQRLFAGLTAKKPALVEQAIAEIEAHRSDEVPGGSGSALIWLARAWLKMNQVGWEAARPAAKLERAYFDFFLADDAKHLKEYLQRKYRAGDYSPPDPESHLDRLTFLDDLILFNNPDRSQWDATERVMAIIGELKPEVRRAIDLGAGFGYFSTRIAETLGTGSVVYAADTEKTYVEQLRRFILDYGIEGIEPILSKTNDIVVREPTDLVFIASLYHVLYAWSQPGERNAFMKTLHRTLRPGGYLIILDNREQEGRSLHNAYVDREFVLAQLYYYGFELVRDENLSPYRYLLVLRKSATPQPPVYTAAPDQDRIRVENADAVIHIGSLDSFDITPSGVAAGRLMLKALAGDQDAARQAIRLYDSIIPNENFGGEYTALQWTARYLLANEDERREMTRDPLTAEFIAYLSKDHYAELKHYIARKYKLKDVVNIAPDEEAVDEKTREIGIVRRQAFEDFILFNNPERDRWENSPKVMALLPIQPGDHVVDVGSGPGFYTFKFAERVGRQGRVEAFDTKDSHIDFLNALARQWGLDQVVGRVSKTDGFSSQEPGSADLVFMCSLYHILYGVSSQAEREGMINSIRQALKPSGRLAIVDNGPVPSGVLPYHGPYIRRELIVSQLKQYGFVLESSAQIIPQRYLLIFRPYRRQAP
ncbi:methyltransferase domain-containing protein [Caldichromatium japonicum]|uniref:Methyltransferase domain-containing protein n=1 Tax=Caldichromatium japonicum TaxID=2699430 RepID=A0A6G7VB60_9GAMM|nr:methyltransferase domain-containing protein [Caldichromatium japonicum]QIK37251.1 methyltransferase domain-containing protein [Caldichromatium japonicum]